MLLFLNVSSYSTLTAILFWMSLYFPSFQIGKLRLREGVHPKSQIISGRLKFEPDILIQLKFSTHHSIQILILTHLDDYLSTGDIFHIMSRCLKLLRRTKVWYISWALPLPLSAPWIYGWFCLSNPVFSALTSGLVGPLRGPCQDVSVSVTFTEHSLARLLLLLGGNFLRGPQMSQGFHYV